MDASLDTNVIIHLYNANLQSVLFNRFEKIKVYEYIRSTEMKNHAAIEIINMFDEDVKDDRIELITDDYLRSIDMYNLFLYHYKEQEILYDVGDRGEVYAIAMAKTLGCMCLVTDDIKMRGPHYTLMMMPNSDIIPFAFYEVLLLDYLDGTIEENELLEKFNLVCYVSDLEWNLGAKLNAFMRRFWKTPKSESEKEWMNNFCKKKRISAKERLQILWLYIQSTQ